MENLLKGKPTGLSAEERESFDRWRAADAAEVAALASCFQEAFQRGLLKVEDIEKARSVEEFVVGKEEV